jgi:hypothetical protein
MNAITLSLRITAPDSAARATAGRRQFAIGRPLEFDEASPHVAAIEYALGAVGGELVNGLREFARRRRMVIDDVEAIVTGELANGLAYLEVIGERGHPSLSRIAVKVFVSSPDESLPTVFAEMVQRLPLVNTLRKALEVQIDLILTS